MITNPHPLCGKDNPKFHGVKGRSGRKKDPRGATRYFNELYDEHAFELAELTIERALNGDRELLIYCHDRRLGKPKQQTDLSIEGGEMLGGGAILELFRQLAQYRQELIAEERKMLERGEDAIKQGEG